MSFVPRANSVYGIDAKIRFRHVSERGRRPPDTEDGNPGERDLIPIVKEAEWAPGSVWTGAEYLAANVIRSPDLPGRSKSLYWLSCADRHTVVMYYRKHSEF